MFAHYPDTVVFINIKGDILYANEAASMHFGYKPDEIKGNYRNFIQRTEKKKQKFHIEDVISRSSNLDTKCKHKNGKWVDVNATIFPYKNDQTIIGVYAIIRDITRQKKMDQKMAKLEKMLEVSQQSGGIGSWEYSLTTNEIIWSNQMYELFGLVKTTNNTLKIEDFIGLVHVDDRSQMVKAFSESAIRNGTKEVRYRIVLPDGMIRYVQERSSYFEDPQNKKKIIIGTTLDITDRIQAETVAKIHKEESTQLCLHLNVAMWTYEIAEKRFISYSDRIFNITGYDPNRFVSGEFDWADYVHKDDRDIYEKHKEVIEGGHSSEQQYRFIREDGKLIWLRDQMIPVLNEDRSIKKIVGVITDITENQMLQDQVENLAYFDRVTMLPNRSSLESAIDRFIDESSPAQPIFGLFQLEINRFTSIVETLGNRVCDDLLSQAAERLRALGHVNVFVSKYGEKSFILLNRDISSVEQSKEFAEQMLECFTNAFKIDEYELFSSATIGASTYPMDGETKEELLRNAQIALSRGKDGGQSFQIFTNNLNAAAYKAYTLEQDMRKALQDKEFEVYYQPRIDIKTNQIVGAEALIRWQHPLWGTVAPSEFIPIAEETGLIMELGDWVLHTVCRQIQQWKNERISIVPIAINVSPQRFLRSNFTGYILKTLASYNLKPSSIEIEITESSLITDIDSVLVILQDLRKAGIRIALDDFGTGYSSLTHLKDLPVDFLKIDQSFIQDIETDEKKAVITNSIIQICKQIDIEVVAEGVETTDQLDVLVHQKCRYIQGYLFCKPIPENEFKELMSFGFVQLQKTRIAPKRDEKRSFYRLIFPKPLIANMSIDQIKGKKTSMGGLRVVLEDLSAGGLRFSATLHLPVRDDVIISCKWTILNQTFTMLGRIVRSTEESTYYSYGVEFLPGQPENENLIKWINKATLLVRNEQPLINTPMIDSSIHQFLKEVKVSGT
ncbi:hypothetical protein KP78_28510 [Jeotgalibacillus soli]|uniref:Diguanylate cyclase n=2 Tax=Jeotgalibacillus soli TaxID=889306 RepID=A0A0C2V8M2_9BACL|nr:hypothetical protein KP78_28510 [Jeotgalibacillus soli]